jgi:hypothetical protein
VRVDRERLLEDHVDRLVSGGERAQRRLAVAAPGGGEELIDDRRVVLVVGGVGLGGDPGHDRVVEGLDRRRTLVARLDAGLERGLVALVERRGELRLRAHLGLDAADLLRRALLRLGQRQRLIPPVVRLAGEHQAHRQRDEEQHRHCAEGGAQLTAEGPGHGRSPVGTGTGSLS